MVAALHRGYRWSIARLLSFGTILTALLLARPAASDVILQKDDVQKVFSETSVDPEELKQSGHLTGACYGYGYGEGYYYGYGEGYYYGYGYGYGQGYYYGYGYGQGYYYGYGYAYGQGYYYGYGQGYYYGYGEGYYYGYGQGYYQGGYNLTITGNFGVTGDVTVSGNIGKGSGSFVIDHPLDPKNKLLYHSFVESPDVKNVYDGIVTLDKNGEAQITLPAYFMALNTEFRYQLKPIGKPQPDLYIKDQIKNNAFTIAGGAPNGRVSWQVTGIRHDPYILANPIDVEVKKSTTTVVKSGEILHQSAYQSLMMRDMLARIRGTVSASDLPSLVDILGVVRPTINSALVNLINGLRMTKYDIASIEPYNLAGRITEPTTYTAPVVSAGKSTGRGVRNTLEQFKENASMASAQSRGDLRRTFDESRASLLGIPAIISEKINLIARESTRLFGRLMERANMMFALIREIPRNVWSIWTQ